MQVVVLSGGLGTRLGAVTQNLPKSLVPIRGKPFLQYQLEWLQMNGIEDIVLCVGHFADQIQSFAGDGRKFRLNISYSYESQVLLGTAGAVKNAEKLLDEEFCVLNGDSYLPLKLRRPMHEFHKRQNLAMMVVYRNRNRFDKSNLLVQDQMVTLYSREDDGLRLDHIDYGLQFFNKTVLSLIPKGEFNNLDILYRQLIDRNELSAFIVYRPFYEIGSFDGLERFTQFVDSNVGEWA